MPPPRLGGDTIDLTECDREPIHVPGSIQPYGLLLIGDAATGLVIAGAGEIEKRLTPAWLGRPMSALMAQDIAPALHQARTFPGTVASLASVPGRGEAFDATLHLSGDRLIVELEPEPDLPVSAGSVLSRLDAISTGFERASDLEALCARAAIAFRELTGFDRVMIYRFLDDAAGMVVGEDRDPLMGSFLNHHFPAGDIPKQARELYVRNRVRVISSVDYVPAPIRTDGEDPGAIDLSDAALRSVSPIHLQYLKNMGVAASASVSIVKDGLLWGLVACHHNSPRRLSYEIRVACSALAGGLARQIRAKEEAQTYRERIRFRAREDAIVARADQDAPIEQFFADMADELRGVLDADGFAVVQGRDVVRSGMCPDAPALLELARWVGGRSSAEPFSTFSLGERFPAARTYQEIASGLLAVTLAGEGAALLMWFRAEQPETVNWAGNPHKAMAGPTGLLTPRHSFEDWCETVRGRSRRWTLGEVEAANRLRRALHELRQSRRLRELNRELSATVTEKEALLQEKDHLLREVNHRVQNSIQLIHAFLGLQSRAADDAALSEALAEAQRRLSAVALVHRRLYQADQVETIDLGRYLDELLGEMLATMDAGWRNVISRDLAPMLITADRAVNIGLILTELVINANKYAYGGAPGPIAISLEPYRNQFRLIVADQGSGKVRTGEGFGTRMMNAMVQRLGGTIEHYDNRPGLRVIVSAPIDQG